ncbi:MAG TPA: nuclear transport factor 2 family protein [Polyangiales bacterium]|jgi:ketosteroid isomerase-like protein
MIPNAETPVQTYFEAWVDKDVEKLRSVLADEVEFIGPLAHLHDAEAYCDSMAGLYRITTRIVVRKRFVDGPDVLTWFELHTQSAEPVAVANWCHVENGKIRRARVAFDPRGLVRPTSQ